MIEPDLGDLSVTELIDELDHWQDELRQLEIDLVRAQMCVSEVERELHKREQGN